MPLTFDDIRDEYLVLIPPGNYNVWDITFYLSRTLHLGPKMGHVMVHLAAWDVFGPPSALRLYNAIEVGEIITYIWLDRDLAITTGQDVMMFA
jgi:hypothetical protein